MRENIAMKGVGVVKYRLRYMVVVLIAAVCVAALLLLSGDFSKTVWFNDGEQRKFGATYMTMSNPYFVVLDEELRESIEENGDILLTRDPSQDQEKQNQQIIDMINEGVSAIFLQPVDWKNVKPALVACREAGVPVISVDAYVFDQEYVVSTIASDNYGAGVLCAEYIMQKQDSAKIVILGHYKMQSVIDRVAGFKDTLAGHPGYDIVLEFQSGADIETGMEAMHNIIDSGIEFDTLFGGNDPVALGGLAALQKEGAQDRKITIYGVDGSPDGKAMIRDGLMEASSAQQPLLLAKTAAETAYAYLGGERVEKEIVIPVTLVTQSNIANTDIDGWQ